MTLLNRSLSRWPAWPLIAAMAAAAACAAPAAAAVSAAEAARLKSDLTPLGGEKAGNKDGSIPAWTGGYTTPIAGDRPGGRRGDPFKDEKPLFSITGKNVDQYADRLTDGQRALLKKFADYRIDVYKTHRTAIAPQWVLDNTARNATRVRLEGNVPSGAYGGIPFPIPKTAQEVMWNHVLRWRGESWQLQVRQYQITADGRPVLTTDGTAEQQMPYYFADGTPEAFWKAPEYWMIRLVNSGPPIRAGEAIVGRNNIDGEKDQAWVYLTGQRRTRRVPTACCDNPSPSTAGLMSFDELEVFTGRMTRFDWKLLGKKEMFIPYNGNRLLQPRKDEEVLGSHFLNPDHVRWELHRVWVVEATLKAGERHEAARSRYYCDEDTWTCVLGDRWDGNGQLWKTLWSHVFVAPDLPGLPVGTFGFNDLLSNTAFVANLYNAKSAQYPLKPRYPDNTFTPDAMAAASMR
jgi:hypothetical protein